MKMYKINSNYKIIISVIILIFLLISNKVIKLVKWFELS